MLGGIIRATRTYLAVVPLATPLLFVLLTPPSDDPRNPFEDSPPIRFSSLLKESAPLPAHSIVVPIDPGDTLESVLLAGGLAPDERSSIARQFAELVDLRRLRPGELIRFRYIEDGTIDQVTMKLRGWGQLQAHRTGDGFAVRSVQFDQTSVEIATAGSIDTSLYDAIRKSGESPLLAQSLADVFQWDVDFFRLQQGDAFSVIAEKRFVGDDPMGYGPILAARFEHAGRVYEAFRHENEDGVAGYYTRAGTPLKKQFLKAPLQFRRITSGFTHRRFHPVLRTFRPHLAIDYGAPEGTPVMSTADGVVRFAGRGSGEGNYIRIRHSSSLETYYLHLSRFAKGISKGKRVEQGDVIGYVGSTGLATAPHLDYRVRQDGKWINPLHLKSVTPDPLRGRSLERFRSSVAAYLPRLEDAGSPEVLAGSASGNPELN